MLNLARILSAFLIVKTINIMLFPQFQGKRVPDLGSAEHEGALVLSCPGKRQVQRIIVEVDEDILLGLKIGFNWSLTNHKKTFKTVYNIIAWNASWIN